MQLVSLGNERGQDRGGAESAPLTHLLNLPALPLPQRLCRTDEERGRKERG